MNERTEGQLSTADMVNAARNGGTTHTDTLTEENRGDTGTMSAGQRTAGDGASLEPQGPAREGMMTGTGGDMTNGHATTGTNGAMGTAAQDTPLLAATESESLRSRWTDIQAQFVDEPRRCVEQADSLVAELMKRLAEMFAGERSKLEQQWDRGDEVSTEDLRQALRRYRSFFERLLSV
jgi:hypothetical protein